MSKKTCQINEQAVTTVKRKLFDQLICLRYHDVRVWLLNDNNDSCKNMKVIPEKLIISRCAMCSHCDYKLILSANVFVF